MIHHRKHINKKLNHCALLMSGFIASSAFSADTPPDALPPPTAADVSYGTHERQKLDFYQAKSDKPTPVLFVIHGGGWMYGDKYTEVAGDRVKAQTKAYLDAGVSVVSINYRYIFWDARIGVVKPPVKWPLEDAARALQFVRSKAKEWNLDKDRICGFGGSAGGCSALWLAFHGDMADPKSDDPVARESTRLWCAAVIGAQTSLDPKQMKEWTPNSKYGGHAFGFMGSGSKPGGDDQNTRDSFFADFLAHREEVLPWIKEYSPYELLTKDDPPVYLIYDSVPALGQDVKDPTHTANFGVKLQEHCKELCVECELVYPGAPDVKHQKIEQYIIEMLKAPAAK